jgi:hypothetical protein
VRHAAQQIVRAANLALASARVQADRLENRWKAGTQSACAQVNEGGRRGSIGRAVVLI